MPLVTVLDHVALAAESADDLWPRYAGDLAGQWEGGGDSVGFSSAQVRFATGMKVEVLSPYRVADNDFLRRFLDASGAGPHHFTFKVPDLRVELVRAAELGFQPINVDFSDPGWFEAFLHPKATGGIVVQLAQSSGEYDGGPRPSWLPSPERAQADLTHIVHLVADLVAAERLFVDLLGGEVVDGAAVADELDGADGMAVAWDGGGRLHLVVPSAGTDAATWMGRRPGRLHHLAFTVDSPDAVPGAQLRPDGRYVVEPEANRGTRLVLTTS